MTNFTPVIGLEVHVELSTATKMFCGCSADPFAKEANTQVCPVCLGLPGALPYPNAKAIDYVVSLGLALNCQISLHSRFDRKHYFYPDLPKSFQTSQYDLPFCFNGKFEGVAIRRIHLEEDTAKLTHAVIDGREVSLIDFNRSGVPLMELVTEPDFTDSETVVTFLKNIQQMVRYLGISSADMEKGSMRLEANISMKPEGSTTLPLYKVELKNINSFRFLKKAIDYEIERQTAALQKGENLPQETRGFDEIKNITVSQRIKEDSADYRYFPEPDLPPIEISQEKIVELRDNLPELPLVRSERFKAVYELSDDYAQILTENRDRADYFEQAVITGKEHGLTGKMIAKAMINQKMDEEYPEPTSLVKILVKSLKQDYASSTDLAHAVKLVVESNPDVVEKYRNGKVEVIGFLMGQVQKELRGKGNPKDINLLLIETLKT